jgi:putative transposase
MLDAALTAFATRRLEEPCPYLILDARYERVRERGVIACEVRRCWWRWRLMARG